MKALLSFFPSVYFIYNMIEEKINENEIKSSIKLPSAQEFLEAGSHFGHKTSRWHPKMEQYIFGAKNDVHILDLEKTLVGMEKALILMRSVLSRGGFILFVGTKPVSKNIIKETALALEMPYVTERWLGGTLTNFKTISKRLQYYRELEQGKEKGDWEKFIKKERVQLQKKLDKLKKQLEGIKNLNRVPEVLFAADVKEENIAVREAKRVGIPVVAICDTNIDPSEIDCIIPANDDAASSIKIIMGAVLDNLKGVKPIVKIATEISEKKIEIVSDKK